MRAILQWKPPVFRCEMSDETGPASPRHQPPACSKCDERERIRQLPVTAAFVGVEYWCCQRCGRVWGTRFGMPVKVATVGPDAPDEP
jgi:hypothetical protein